MVVFSDGVFNCMVDDVSSNSEKLAIDEANRAVDLHGVNVYSVFCPSSPSLGDDMMKRLIRGDGSTHRCDAFTDLPSLLEGVAELLPTTAVVHSAAVEMGAPAPGIEP